MYKHRIDARVDANQPIIVEQLRAIPGVTVAVGHDDILIGYRGQNFWYEIKRPEVIKKSGEPMKGAIKESQELLLTTWNGHYKIVWSVEQILEDIGVINGKG